jgi:quercetin dioxygenase-like cupin family protein
MEEINRRSALALGVATAAATPLFTLATPASAAEVIPEYGPNDGKEVAPGVRVVEVGTWDSDMVAAKSVLVVDAIFQPGATAPESVMDNDMLCLITAGEFTIKKADREFNVKTGDYYTCGKGKTDEATNISSGVGIHRIAIFTPA